MTLERVLEAAIGSMIRGNRPAHCYRSHVLGKGYVNDGSSEFDRADYLRSLEREARHQAENMLWTHEYAEPGYDQPRKGILFADWNVFPTELDTILEKLGYEVEWYDEWDICEGCNRALRTQPNSYDWKPQYAQRESEFVCLECADDE